MPVDESSNTRTPSTKSLDVPVVSMLNSISIKVPAVAETVDGDTDKNIAAPDDAYN